MKQMTSLIVTLMLLLGAGIMTSPGYAQSISDMEKDLLALPEMKQLQVELVSEPGCDELYYTFKAVEEQENHAVTLYWFHVYTQPQYEIKFYDIATDSEYTVKEWRENNPGETMEQWGQDFTTSIPAEGLFSTYRYPEMGFSIKMTHGKVYLQLDKERIEKCSLLQHLHINNISSQPYEIKGLKSQCKGIFVGDIGQDIHPILCMLMENGRVNILSIYHTLENLNDFGLLTSGELPGLTDIVSFECDGGGPYEEDGETYYSYTTIYGIDSQGQRHEIELWYPSGTQSTQYSPTQWYQLSLSADWKFRLVENPGTLHSAEFTGHFYERSHDTDYKEYQLGYISLPQKGEKSQAGMILGQEGEFTLETTPDMHWRIYPDSHPLLLPPLPIQFHP